MQSPHKYLQSKSFPLGWVREVDSSLIEISCSWLKMLSDLAKRNAHWQGNWSRSNRLYFSLCINLRSSLLSWLHFLAANTDWEQTEVIHYAAESSLLWFGRISEHFVWGRKKYLSGKSCRVYFYSHIFADRFYTDIIILSCKHRKLHVFLHFGTQVLWGYCPFWWVIAIILWYCWVLQQTCTQNLCL